MAERSPSPLLTVDPEGVAWITFADPDRKMNVLDEGVIRRLAEHIDELAGGSRDRVKAVVVFSGKPDSFMAGADVDAIKVDSQIVSGPWVPADVVHRPDPAGDVLVHPLHILFGLGPIEGQPAHHFFDVGFGFYLRADAEDVRQARHREMPGPPVKYQVVLEDPFAQHPCYECEIVFFFKNLSLRQMTLLDSGRFELADCDSVLDSEFGKLLLAETLESELLSQSLSEEFSPLLLSSRDTYELHDTLPPESRRNRSSSSLTIDYSDRRSDCTPHRHSG